MEETTTKTIYQSSIGEICESGKRSAKSENRETDHAFSNVWERFFIGQMVFDFYHKARSLPFNFFKKVKSLVKRKVDKIKSVLRITEVQLSFNF